MNAAETVLKMAQQLSEMEAPGEGGDIEYQNAVSRRVANKEEHAKKCKYELLDVLWTQYFKPEHVERWPDLHDTFFRAGHLCTQNMQQVSVEKAQELFDLTKEIADIFAESKK